MASAVKTVKSPAKKTNTPARGRQNARSTTPVANGRGRSATPARNAGRNVKPVRENRLAFIGKGWFNVRKDSQLTDAQIEKAYAFIDQVLLPNFYQKLTIDRDYKKGVTVFSGDNIKLWQNNKRDEINDNTGEVYQDADTRLSVAMDDDGEDIEPSDFY